MRIKMARERREEMMRERGWSMGIDFVCFGLLPVDTHTFTHSHTHTEGTVSAVSERDR